ncbi:hypothetical protein SKAU_G00147670 [Synaphobranchus kaupii]|uniref:Death domain-containing protein n=1 Tax=Synaphobranchus kaupii TaxID=118154 RepID=A0A9Q1FTG1_SYNKA|nr:hypothetical protein SKAU_G00147670 [Synaphobranchus kaupii]
MKVVEGATQVHSMQVTTDVHGDSVFDGVESRIHTKEPLACAPEALFGARPQWNGPSVETPVQQTQQEGNPEEVIERKDQRLSIVADHLGYSWTELAQELEFSRDCIQQIPAENPSSLQDQSHACLKLWVERERENSTEKSLVKALTAINRVDIVPSDGNEVVEPWPCGVMEKPTSPDHSEGFSVLQGIWTAVPDSCSM